MDERPAGDPLPDPTLVVAWRQARRRLLCGRDDEGIDRSSAWARICDRQLLPKQKLFVEHDERRLVLFSGSLAGGKTRALCTKLVRRASIPGAREGICRKRLVDLRATTLVTLLEPDGDLPPVLPAGTYSHNQNKRVIDLAPSGGGQIVYFGMGVGEGGPQKLGSLNLSGCAIDEVIELTPEDFEMVDGQVRRNVRHLRSQVYCATNPAHPQHHVAVLFGVEESGCAPDPDSWFVRARLDDNPYLRPDFVARQHRRTGVGRRRYVEGIWSSAEGLVYDTFDPQVNVRERDALLHWSRVVIGVDDGFTHPYVALLGLTDGDGRLHIADEVYQSGMRMPQKVEAIERLVEGARARISRRSTFSDWRAADVERLHLEAVPCDPSAALLIATLRDAGLPAMEADNAVDEGIARVRERLMTPEDEVPRLTVSSRCVNLIRQFATYEMAKTRTGALTEHPVKEDDDAVDALRYLVSYVDGTGEAFKLHWIGGRAAGRDRRNGRARGAKDER